MPSLRAQYEMEKVVHRRRIGYLQDSAKTEKFVDGVLLCRGKYLMSAVAGTFELSLATEQFVGVI